MIKNKDEKLPLVSFIIPTFNTEKTLDLCLNSIFSQEYPKDRIEVLIIDGGSTDRTLEIAKKYPTRILSNPFGHQDSFNGGRNIGVKAAKGELLAFINSDQELSSSNWLKFMVKPFIEDNEIVESISSILIKKNDLAINRYNSYKEDPLLGSINRGVYSMYEYPKRLTTNSKSSYIAFYVRKNDPVEVFVGTGILVKKKALIDIGGYDFDRDTAIRLINKGYNKFAFIDKVGIYHHHYHTNNFIMFIRRKIRLVKTYLRFRSLGIRGKEFESYTIPSNKYSLIMFFIGVLYNLSFIGPLFYSIKMAIKYRDIAWLYHTYAVISTLAIYVVLFIKDSTGRQIILTKLKNIF